MPKYCDAIVGQLWLLVLTLPLFCNAQLKEFEVSEMERPDVAVVQANTRFPDDALLLVYSSLDGLQFRSSMGAVDKQTYNNTAGRYEILVKPVKQMMFVAKPGFMELKIATINPNPKDVFYYKVEEKQQAVVNTKPGTLKIITEPSGADVFINGIKTADKTPFEGELNPGGTRIKLQKAKHETIDTTVAVKTGEPTVLNVQMKPTTLWVNISSTPSGANVTLDGVSRGTTPASFELDHTDRTKWGSKQLQLTLADYNPVINTIELQPSSTPAEFKYALQKQTGSFDVTSTPDGAQVFIDGQYKGITPLHGSMEVGRYEVEVKLEKHYAPTKKLEVMNEIDSELKFQFHDGIMSRQEEIELDQVYEINRINGLAWFSKNIGKEPKNGRAIGYVKRWQALQGALLYGYDAAIDVCPNGSHLATKEEWENLALALSSQQTEEEMFLLRESCTNSVYRDSVTNFTAELGGFYSKATDFTLGIGNTGYWWVSDPSDSSGSKKKTVAKISLGPSRLIFTKSSKKNACSVRCVLD